MGAGGFWFSDGHLVLCPGISETTAQVFIAETGGDVSRFPTSGYLRVWVAVIPASYESAGKRRPAAKRHMRCPMAMRTLIEAAEQSYVRKATSTQPSTLV